MFNHEIQTNSERKQTNTNPYCSQLAMGQTLRHEQLQQGRTWVRVSSRNGQNICMITQRFPTDGVS